MPLLQTIEDKQFAANVKMLRESNEKLTDGVNAISSQIAKLSESIKHLSNDKSDVKEKEQKYNFADVIIKEGCDNETTKQVTVALQPMENLGIEFGDYTDNQIYYYFKDYEEFLSAFLTVSMRLRDFYITQIIDIYDKQ